MVVVDEAGQFAISLLSGHVGGANRLTEWTAEILNGSIGCDDGLRRAGAHCD